MKDYGIFEQKLILQPTNNFVALQNKFLKRKRRNCYFFRRKQISVSWTNSLENFLIYLKNILAKNFIKLFYFQQQFQRNTGLGISQKLLLNSVTVTDVPKDAFFRSFLF